MSYKSIMTHLTGTKAPRALVTSIAALATAEGAHFDVLCHGSGQLGAGFHYGAVDPIMVQQSMQLALEEAQDLEASVREILQNTEARWGVERLVNPQGLLSRTVALRSRFADMVVLASPYSDDAHPDEDTILEGALLHGDAPVLVIPDGQDVPVDPGIVLIGWNESAEALKAVKAALPILKKAKQVRVTVIDPPRHGTDRSDPGGPMSVFLARHGVKTEIDVIGKSLPRISDVLQRHAQDKGADMLVMGGYGRSRIREAILGGATRDMLEQARIPIFMKH